MDRGAGSQFLTDIGRGFDVIGEAVATGELFRWIAVWCIFAAATAAAGPLLGSALALALLWVATEVPDE
ncbi:hypothetical protein LCGC14_0859850 [marine sediment metagenome]|uniref:Uncharacterized protein n=1 Tax=marine sediment metagenome TaxID=412755 RepID=A0A0F9P7Q0_9ZZZZ